MVPGERQGRVHFFRVHIFVARLILSIGIIFTIVRNLSRAHVHKSRPRLELVFHAECRR